MSTTIMPMFGTHDCVKAPLSACLIAAVRGLRQGIYYGGRVRFAHSIVMQLLFGKGNAIDKFKRSAELAWQHGWNLGRFVFIYKLVQCLLTKLIGVKHPSYSFFAGMVGAFFIWKERNAVNQQIAFYLLSRVLEGIGQTLIKEKVIDQRSYFPYVSIIVWGIVMYLFERDKSNLQSSLSSSMVFLYKDSDQAPTNWRDFVPVYIPQ